MHQADAIMQEVSKTLRNDFQMDPVAVYGYSARNLQIGLDKIMEQAVPVRRKSMASSRADAIEMSFDYLLNQVTKGEWVRAGEVHIDRELKVCEALCHGIPRRSIEVKI